MTASYAAVPVAKRPAYGRNTWFRYCLITGVLCVIAGGLLAAATAYVTTEKTAWATAYLVLVGGVAQVTLGATVAWLRPAAPARLARDVWALWNLGNAGVLIGQLAGLLVVTDVGTVLLVAALAATLLAVIHRGYADGQRRHRGVLVAFRLLVVVLAITMPIGVVLAHLGS